MSLSDGACLKQLVVAVVTAGLVIHLNSRCKASASMLQGGRDGRAKYTMV